MSYEEDDFSKDYEFIDWVTNTERAEIDGKDEVFLRSGFGSLRPILIAMEAMAREVEFDKDTVGFDIRTDERGKTVVVPKAKTKAVRYFMNLNAFLHSHASSKRYVFSPHVQAVSEALEASGFNSDTGGFRFREPGMVDLGTGKTHGEIFNEVVAKIAEIVASSRFRERLRVRQRNAERNEARGLAIEQKVFENKSRQVLLMLHFGYQEPYRRTLTLEEIQKHRQKFFNNCRSNKLLRGIVDYIWTIEEGDESGLHLHMLIFHNADFQRDVYIAKLIGDYWVKVTGGIGQYWNSNANKAFHAKYGHGVGTGEINWDNFEKRVALRENIRYMTKADQFLKMKYGKRSHLFGTSRVEEKKKPGRPRKQFGDLYGMVDVDAGDDLSGDMPDVDDTLDQGDTADGEAD